MGSTRFGWKFTTSHGVVKAWWGFGQCKGAQPTDRTDSGIVSLWVDQPREMQANLKKSVFPHFFPLFISNQFSSSLIFGTFPLFFGQTNDYNCLSFFPIKGGFSARAEGVFYSKPNLYLLSKRWSCSKPHIHSVELSLDCGRGRRLEFFEVLTSPSSLIFLIFSLFSLRMPWIFFHRNYSK